MTLARARALAKVTPTGYRIPAKMLYDTTPYGRPHPPNGSTPVSEAAVAYAGWGTYRPGCAERTDWDGWLCGGNGTRLNR